MFGWAYRYCLLRSQLYLVAVAALSDLTDSLDEFVAEISDTSKENVKFYEDENGIHFEIGDSVDADIGYVEQYNIREKLLYRDVY